MHFCLKWNERDSSSPSSLFNTIKADDRAKYIASLKAAVEPSRSVRQWLKAMLN
jgi:hypothetical protein